MFEWLRTRDGHIEVAIELVLDVYQAYMCDAVREWARELKIDLHFVPAREIDLSKPAEVSRKNPMISKFTALFREKWVPLISSLLPK
jgi:hypothetical protein